MTAEQAIAYVECCTWSTTRLGLKRTRVLLHALGDPQKELKFVHVAGSNGKGSACAMLAAILQKAGYRTGLYISPYIQDFCERIQVDGQAIPREDLATVTEKVRAAADRMSDHPSQFELVTVLAMVYFRAVGCDIVVLEVGLGGRLDATNAIPSPEAAVIMNIGLEHTEYLGNTLAQIAAEKAGIIKKGCTAVTYPGPPEVEAVYEAACAAKGAELRKVEFSALHPLRQTLEGQWFHWREVRELHITLLGEHQLRNAAVVIETVEVLRQRGWSISEKALRQGLAQARWPARLELLGSNPCFLLDGAHNPQCAQALAGSIRTLFPDKKVVFLAGVLSDKDYPQMLRELIPLAQEFFCLTPNSPRALPAGELEEFLHGRGVLARSCADASSGIRAALSAAGEEGVVVAFGSLYLAGALRSTFWPAYRTWLRKEKIRARDSLDAEKRDAFSRLIVRRLAATPEFQAAKTVLIYKATRGEVRLEM